VWGEARIRESGLKNMHLYESIMGENVDILPYLQQESLELQAQTCPRSLCHDCHRSFRWKVGCRACKKPLCKEHDFRALKLRKCGFRDLNVEREFVRNPPPPPLAARGIAELRIPPFGEKRPIDTTASSGAAATPDHGASPSPQPSVDLAIDDDLHPVAMDRSESAASNAASVSLLAPPLPPPPPPPAALLPMASSSASPTPRPSSPAPDLASSLASLHPPLPLTPSVLPPLPSSSASSATPRGRSLSLSSRGAAAALRGSSAGSASSSATALGRGAASGVAASGTAPLPPLPCSPGHPVQWRGCGAAFCPLVRPVGDGRGRCTADVRECAECGVLVCEVRFFSSFVVASLC